MKIESAFSTATRIGSVLTMFLVLISFASPAYAVNAGDDEPDLYDWFDGLGFHEFEKLPLVKVTTGWWSRSGNEPAKNQEIYAFLVEGDKSSKKFSVFTFQLEKQEFEKTPLKTPAHEVVQFEPVDLAEFCRALLEARQAPGAGAPNFGRRFAEKVNEGTEFFVLARACAAQGENELAQQLIEVAGPLLKQRIRRDAPATTFQEDLSNDLAHRTMWRIVLDFGDPKVSRQRLLERLEEFKKNYPNSTHFKRARETASLLKKMLFQEKKHKPVKDLKALPVKERVAELIFQLREQNGHQFMQPGACDIFLTDLSAFGMEDADKPPPSPAHQLVEIGFDAVPQLIEAMEDKEFTRSVGYHRNFYFSHHVLRVGDCAERILSRIANRSFYRRNYTNGAMVKDSEQQTVKQQVEAWWKEVQTKGEKQVLIEATESGGDNSYQQAYRLAEKYPDVALASIVKGVRAAENPYVKSNLMRTAAKFGEPAMEFLTAEMKRLGPLQHRVDAANGVFQLKPKLAIEAMIVEWNRLLESPSKKVLDNDDVDSLIEFLVRCSSKDAIDALHQGFGRCTPDKKLEIVSVTYSRDLEKDSPQVDKSIEALLITAAADTSSRSGYSGSWGGYSFSNPQICNLATYALSVRYPIKYKFNTKAIGDEADAQCRGAINRWRSENSMELLPDPTLFKVEKVPAKKIAALIRKITESKSDQQTKAALAAIKLLGPGALESVVEQTKALPDDSDARQALNQLACELSLTVTRIKIAKSAKPLPADLRMKINAFENKPLASDGLVDLFTWFVSNLPKGSSGIRVTALRSDPNNGVQMKFELTEDWPAETGSQQMWNTSSSIMLDGESLGSSSGRFSIDHATTRKAYQDFAVKLNKVLQSKQDKTLQVSYSLIRDE